MTSQSSIPTDRSDDFALALEAIGSTSVLSARAAALRRSLDESKGSYWDDGGKLAELMDIEDRIEVLTRIECWLLQSQI